MTRRVDLKKWVWTAYQTLPQEFKKYPIFLATSGGMDSTVLASIALSLREKLPPLHWIHLNYRLRIPDSDSEEQSLKEWAKGEKVAFFSKRFSSKNKPKNLQAWAREKRFQFFHQIIQKKFKGKGTVWLAHHQQDQAETVFHRLLRGAGLEGLGGMERLEVLKDLHGKKFSAPLYLFRPLLEVPHEAIQHYAKVHHLSYHQDRSNLTDQYLRNRIRRQIFPLLLKENPQIMQVLVRLGSIAKEAKNGLRWVAENYLSKPQAFFKTKNSLQLKPLRGLPASLVSVILEKWLKTRLDSPQSYHRLLPALEMGVCSPVSREYRIPLKGKFEIALTAERFSIVRKRKGKSGLRKPKALC